MQSLIVFHVQNLFDIPISQENPSNKIREEAPTPSLFHSQKSLPITHTNSSK